MGRPRFVVPTVDRILLTEGDWIEVKHELNNGESKRLEASGLRPPTVAPNGRVISPIDWEVYEIERVLIFLVDWSFRDPKTDKPVKVSGDSLRALNIETFQEINAAIIRHVAEVAAAKKLEAEERERANSQPPTPPESPKPIETDFAAT